MMHHKPNERIRYLLEQYYNNTLSHSETAELSRLLNVTDQEELIDILTLTMGPFSATENPSVDEAEINTQVSKILAVDKNFQLKTTRNTSIFRLLKYSAVAATVIFVGSYFLFYQNRTNLDQKIRTEETEKDVQPGRNGAILVLSDGTQVPLDSASARKVFINPDGSKIQIRNGQVVYLDSKNIDGNDLNSIKTPVGRKYSITLSDGTKVWLNASSSIAYPISFLKKKARKVTISGEVYFEVAKNPQKPFIVNIQNSQTNIEVLGTHFNINTYSDNGNYKTTLLHGSIKLNTGKRHYLLTPNQQAVSQPGSEQVQVINNINSEDILAWKNDLFHFNEASIDDVMSELARWYSIVVVYDGPKPQSTFTGKIQKNLTLKQALKILGATRVKYELTQDNKLIIQ